MTWAAENLFQNILSLGVLFFLFLIIYMKIRGRTFLDLMRDIRDLFSGPKEIIEEVSQGGFKDIK